ncbi:hypothetical protein [Phenylobacterium sp.]|uniref:hypothetical protein n=1 Tax=Phenylobacterium sp. TaxID=1871053 RepID=UPI002F957F15
MAGAEQPWWIIGSAAVALHAGEVADVRDVDVLMSVADAEAALQRAGAERLDGKPHSHFRSSVFGVWRKPPLPVEIMAGFRLLTESGWDEVLPTTRRSFHIAGRELFTPSSLELREIMLSFGRPKDLLRAKLL